MYPGDFLIKIGDFIHKCLNKDAICASLLCYNVLRSLLMDTPLSHKGATVKQISLLFSVSFLIAVPFAVMYTGDTAVFSDWVRILANPCPLITDYYLLGSLSAAFLNASLCCMVCTFILYFTDHDTLSASHLAGFFLVAAHCFYGLNLLNMWSPIIGIFLYSKVMKEKFRDHLDIAMLSTAFGPFMSELMFRYPLSIHIPINLGPYTMNLWGAFLALLLGIFLGFAIPAMLPGAKLLHRGFNLYNAGLAFGLLGLLLYSFMYRTFGVEDPKSTTLGSGGVDYFLFCNLFFGIVFLICLIKGWSMNGKSLKGYRNVLRCSGYDIDFLDAFDCSLTWINLGFYGMFMVLYFDFVILVTSGVGWTGATCGVTLAAISFAAAGQHPRNVWPIIAGYALMNGLMVGLCLLAGRPIAWTLSTQLYMNSLAFATGLCPFAGHFGALVGIMAGALDAVLCVTTSQIHGGLVLYNGGLTAGLTAVILMPILAHYSKR